MSGGNGKHNLGPELKGKMSGLKDDSAALYIPGPNGYILAWGDTVPSDASTGYASGCLFINTDCTNQSDVLYCNIGDSASSDFNLVTVAS